MIDPETWLNKNFKGWESLLSKEKKAIRDFPILWSIFELRATGQRGRPPNANPLRICEAIESLNVTIDVEILEKSKRHFSNRYFEADQPSNAYRALRVRSEYYDSVKIALLCNDVEAKQLLLGLLLIVNRLRNNFLHGKKAEYAFAGQFENFSHANNILMYSISLWDKAK